MLTSAAMGLTGRSSDASASYLRRRISQLLSYKLPKVMYRKTATRSAKPERSMAVDSDRVTGIAFHDETLVLRLVDGCMLTVPLAWFPRLLRASSDERENWTVTGNGSTVIWPDLDETINVATLLRRQGIPADDLFRDRSAGA